MPDGFFATTKRVVSLALRVVDDITSDYVSRANVKLSNVRYSRLAIAKADGFYVFTDIVPGSYQLSIDASNFEHFSQSIDLPLTASVVLDIPGENELMLSVTNSNTTTEIVNFAARHFYQPINEGTLVISSRRISSLVETLEGEGVTEATLDEVGSGASRIRRRDVLRLVGERLIRLRPEPHYRFPAPHYLLGDQLRRLSGTIRDAATERPIDDATVELSRIGSATINFEDVGTTAENTVRVYTVGNNATTKRVFGVTRDVRKSTNARGQYIFYFPLRPDLTIDQVTVNATATGYAAAPPADVDLTIRAASIENFSLNRV